MANAHTVDRPFMPKDYGIPSDTNNLLPWSHAVERLERAQIYWIGTVRPDGRPHVSPVWGVWLDDALYFDGSPETRRGRNLAHKPDVAIHIESGGAGKDVVILEGQAQQIRGADRGEDFTRRLAASYSTKYASENYAPEPNTWDNGGLYEVRPRVVLAWTTFNVDPTRWRFEQK